MRKTRARSKRSAKLAAYRKKRDFSLTPEPQGVHSPRGNIFVVQKHAARRLHYDFRLALDGTLKSWAVAKGPSLDPNDRRLAVHVEDHPMDYANFEGIIPQGQYGGGTVMVWDAGTWDPIGDPRAAYKKGHLQFQLHGKKLKGRWHLVRMRGRGDRSHDYWLLIKGKDDEARTSGASILEQDASALSGRSMEQIASPARGKPAVWASKGSRAAAPRPKIAAKAKLSTPKRAVSLPPFIPPQLATLVEKPPINQDWLHEIKLDGYRAYCRIEKGACRLLTRRGLDWTSKFPALAKTLAKLPVRTAALDGEIAAVDANGLTDFGSLQNLLSLGRTDDVVFFAFDLLHHDGADLRRMPLERRKALLENVLGKSGLAPDERPTVVYSRHFASDGSRFFQHACHMALEGVVSKRADSAYSSGRGSDWVKSKCRQRQEFVIGGYRPRTNHPNHIGALLLGYYEDGDLRYCGKVGTGMGEAQQKSLHKKLHAKRRDTPPFSSPPAQTRKVTWVRPDVVCEVEFHNWTRDGLLRQASFQGLRLDRKATDIGRERPVPTEAVMKKKRTEPEKRAQALRISASKSRRSSKTRSTPRQASTGASVLPRLTHPDRLLFSAQGLTKQQLADYYTTIADHILPHLVGRPLSLVRCPSGKAKCFYQKHPAVNMSKTVRRIAIRDKTKSEDYLAIDDLAGLIELVQFGSLEIHPWGARIDDIERPDRIIFDLDPDPSVPWKDVIAAAREIRTALESVGLESFAKTTGGKGLHVVTPIVPKNEWPTVKNFARTFAEFLVERSPGKYTATPVKRARHGKIFLDYLRNERGATAIAPYSPRAREGAPVSVPLAWREVAPKLDPKSFTVDVVRKRLASLKTDPWERFFDIRQDIEKLSIADSGSKRRSPKRA